MPRLLAVVVLVVVAAGCASPEAPPAGPSVEGAPTPTTPDGSPNATAPPVGARSSSVETFVLQADHSIAVLTPGAVASEGRVAETNPGLGFFTSVAQDPSFVPWVSAPFRVPFEAMEPFDVRVAFASDVPAASGHPAALELPPVLGWLGTPDRWTFFLLASDAPQSLEPGVVYTTTMTVPVPPTGFFVREGETIALHLFLGYQAADGQPIDYVVGGAEPAGFALPHEHFNVSAPRATVVVEAAGEMEAHAGTSTADHPKPGLVPFTVPDDAVYVVLELQATGSAPGRLDADLQAMRGSEDLAGGWGPFAKEVVVLGPSALEGGRDLVARVTSAGPPASFTVKVTAYSP